MPADCGGRPGAAAGPGTGQGRHSAAPAAQISWHSALLNPLLRTSHYFRSSPSRLSSGLSPPAGQSLRRDVSHAAPATSVNLPPSSCDTYTSIIAPCIGPELRELTAGTLSTPRPLHPPRSSAGSGPHPRTGRTVDAHDPRAQTQPKTLGERAPGGGAGRRSKGPGGAGVWGHHTFFPSFGRAEPKVRCWRRGSSLGLPGLG